MAYQPERPAETDWAKQTTDTIERVIGSVRDKTTGPLVKLARVVVFGTLAAIVGIAALVLLAIVLVRVLNLLPGDVWVAHLITGAVFSLAGLFLWRKRTVLAA